MGNNKSKDSENDKLSDQELAVLKKTSNLSEEEIKLAYSSFKSVTSTGKVDRAHFRELTKIFVDPTDIDGRSANVIFDTIDKNHDNVIDFSEFLAIATIKNGLDLDTKLELGFGLLDVSNDGYISYDEIKQFLGFGKKLARTEREVTIIDLTATEIFKKFGLEKNEKISKTHFIEGCKSNPELEKIFVL